MNVNSVEVTNFRQILTLLRAINYGNVRFILSRDLTKYFANCHPRFRFPLRGGERNISAPSSLCFQNMDERLAGRIVLKYRSSCWFSLFLLLVQPCSQGFSHWIWEGREKTLASAGHVIRHKYFVGSNLCHRYATALKPSIVIGSWNSPQKCKKSLI